MRKPRLLAVAALLSTVMLSGCVQPPIESPTLPEPPQPPAFASDQEALTAATDAYVAYTKMSYVILSEQGEDPSRIEDFATGDFLDSELESYETFREKKYRTINSGTVTNSLLQRYSENLEDPINVVSIYLCLDITDVDVVDEFGNSQVTTTRPNQQPFVATFDAVPDPDHLRLSTRDAISRESSVCKN